jgi:Ser/Thr protein kinase RdoA (MazF antagonist)
MTLHEYGGYRFTLFDSVGGRSFEVDNWEQLEGVGRYLGRVHAIGKQSLFQSRPTIGLDEYLYQPRELLQAQSFIPSYLENSFYSDLDLLISTIEEHWDDSHTSIRLHGDCHPGNILWRDNPVFVDLDDSRNGPAIQDLWMLLNGDRNDKIAQLDTVLEGYQEFSTFNDNQLKLIEPLRGLRMVHYMAWLAKRWQDPAFPIAFPWFNEPRYWEGQVLGFKEQISALQETPLVLSPQW